MEIAFEIIKKNDGITTDDNYPYEGIDGKCDAPKDNGVIVTIDGHEDVPGNDENALLMAVANHVSVASDGGSSNFLFYSKGVFTGFCRTELNHGVAAVGYGSDSHGRKNWTVRNSWRPECGEKGYIKIERRNSDSEGRCGIAMEASYSYPIKLSSCNPSKDADLKDEL